MSEDVSIGSLRLLAGQAQGPPRAPILFVHGFLATGWVFHNYLDFFAARGHPAYALHLRGREGSRPGTAIGRVSVADFVADATEAARALGRPIVVGHSLGGLVAQKLAEQGDAAAVVLLSPAPPRGIPLLTPRLVAAMSRYLGPMLRSRPFVARWEDFRALVLAGIPPEERQELFERFVADSGRAARELALGVVGVDRSRVRCPLLVVGGDADRFIPLPIVRRVAARYGAPLYVARGHAHLLPLEPRWETPARYIADWIDASVGARSPNPEVLA